MTRIDNRAASRGMALAVIAAALLLAAPAEAQRTSLDSLAADHGELLGNQNGGATPIFACTVIDQPGSYVVVQNLVAVGDCLVVTADNVTIDLGGHVLTGDGTGDGVTTDGTALAPRTSITIHDGTVSGFVRGVDLGSANVSMIWGVRAVGNGNFGITAGDGSTVSGNTVRDNGGTGIVASAHSAMTGNTASDNGGGGIGSGEGSVVTGNTAGGNGSIGISVSVDAVVSGNTARDNGSTGILAGAGSTVSGNTANRNVNFGILASSGSTVTGNTALANNGAGIRASCPSNVIGNTAISNTGGNLLFSSAACLSVNNLAP